MDELLQHSKIQALFRARIDTLQQQFAHYEQVKRFTLLTEPFSMERGELTNTQKLKRSVVAKNYKGQIDKMYEEYNFVFLFITVRPGVNLFHSGPDGLFFISFF